ncbi:MAG: ADP-ribosyltransferase domain-containing protein [Bacteriovoracaceae bacterium]|nr:ADP-ribosyltransferase domain-containing protein [Bacteriovoracaceae bacterium]
MEDLLIGEYTSNLYKDLNISLRDTSDQGFCKKINQELIHYLINQKNPFKGVVYSGQNLPNEFKEKNLKQKQCYQMGHYLSTSKNSEVALKFANNYATTFIMKFHSKNGSFIQEYSYIRAEEEVLFPPGTVLQYVGQNPIYYNKNSRKYNSPDGAREASELIPLLDFNEVKDSEIGSVCGVKSKSKIKKVFLFDM